MSVRQSFGIDSDLQVPAFSQATEYVPEIDDAYRFDRDTTLAILDSADTILTMLSLEITSIKNMRLFLEVAEQLGYEGGKVRLVLNRADSALGIRVADVENSVGRKIDHQVVSDGRTVEGSHCLMAVGSIPNTAGLGLEEAGVRLGRAGHIEVDRVSRTSARGVYAAGDCTGVLMLASVAAMQGRIAMWHFLGDAVAPLDLKTVSANVFTAPEIATVGWTQDAVEAGEIDAETVMLPLSGNARAKMQGVRDGFVKLFARRSTCTTRSSTTHCARSLSGVQMQTCSTSGSAAAMRAAAASASSASSSTIGHTATPMASSASSRGWNCASSAGSMPALVL